MRWPSTQIQGQRQAICGIFALFGVLFACLPSWACGPIFRGHGQVVDEEALIIWDSKTQTEHFIRRARFDTEDEGMGFLVPTPNQPRLAEVDEAVFERLVEQIQPITVVKNVWHFSLLWDIYQWFFPEVRDRAKVSRSVQVMDVKAVAGYQASVLKASAPQALTNWLQQNKYPSSPELTQWLQPFIKKGWFITAFQLDKTAQTKSQSELTLKALKLSFKTHRPVYPYTEPARPPSQDSETLSNRALRLFLIADIPLLGEVDGYTSEMAAALESTDMPPYMYTENRADLLYANPLKAEEIRSLLAGIISPAEFPNSPWLTAYFDRSRARPPSALTDEDELKELFFYRAAKDAAFVETDMQINLKLFPLDILILGILGFVGWRQKRAYPPKK